MEKTILCLLVLNLTVRSLAEIVLSDEIKIELYPQEGTTYSSLTDLPVVLSSPSHKSILVGDSVILPCRVDHLRHHVVIWKRGRTRTLFAGPIRADTDKKFSLTNRTFLQIEKVTPEYAGEYICQINTKPPIELVHTLNILVAPTITLDPKDGYVFVKEGDPAVVRCIPSGYPTPVITWTAIKGSLPGGVREKQGSVLSIASTDVQHTGTYECKAENGVGEPAIASVKIKVFFVPEIMVSPTWQHAGSGSTVEFRCSAASEPPATLYWTRVPPKDLSQDRHVTFQSESTTSRMELTMRIRQITRDRLGTYACFANNTIGSAYKTVEVSGLAEPVKFRSNSTGEESESFLLIWTVTSYSSIIEYLLRIRPVKEKRPNSQSSSWIDVMIPVEGRQSVLHSHNYNITGLEPGIGYEVVIQARNDFGWNHPSETFTFSTYNEHQSDEWEFSTTSTEMTTEAFYVTDLPLQMTDDESSSPGENRGCSIFSPATVALIVFSSLCIL